MLRRTLMSAAPLLALAACGRGGGEDDAATPAHLGEGRVAAVIDGTSLVLDTGLEVRLAGLVAPLPAAGPASAEPFFADARDALAELAVGRRAALATPPGLEPRDRWGRAPARVTLPERGGVSLNREMAALGLARVRAEDEADAEARALLALEDTARRTRRGLWASPYFAVREADAVTFASHGSFQLVEGVVVDAAATRGGWIYLNFGPDYRTDFTAGAPPEYSDAFDEAAMLALPAARIRVRGEIEAYNGPFIRLVVPAQVERLGEGER
jgi:endonuclease YncB( thermonuclease family)